MIGGYKVITLCGSTRFKDDFLKVQKQLTLQGNIVISVGLFGHSGDDEVWNDGTKEMLDDMHKRKIDMADGIFVIDVDEYIGESTKSEIEYAKAHGKTIQYCSCPTFIMDEVGGVHDEGLGWNPNGVFCGECSNISCKDCKMKNARD